MAALPDFSPRVNTVATLMARARQWPNACAPPAAEELRTRTALGCSHRHRPAAKTRLPAQLPTGRARVARARCGGGPATTRKGVVAACRACRTLGTGADTGTAA